MDPLFKHPTAKVLLYVKNIGDSLLLGMTFESCFKNIVAAAEILTELGFTIHPENSLLFPTQEDNIPRVCNRVCKNENYTER